MIVGLIVERRDNVFLVCCKLGDYEIPVSECNSLHQVGSWIGVYLSGSKIKSRGILQIDDLPRVRIVQGKVEVLTTGSIIGDFCETKDFGCIPILRNVPHRVSPCNELQIWVVRLTTEENNSYQGAKWGVSEILYHATPNAKRNCAACQNEGVERDFMPEEISTNCGKTNSSDYEVSSSASNTELLGVITNVVTNFDSELIGFVWTQYSVSGHDFILHYANSCDYQAFKPGQWIQFDLPLPSFWKALDSIGSERSTLELSTIECEAVEGPFDTRVTRSTVEIDVPISLSKTHQKGDSFFHEYFGAVEDPIKLLEAGRSYIASIIRVQTRPTVDKASWETVRVTLDERSFHREFEESAINVTGLSVRPSLRRSTSTCVASAKPYCSSICNDFTVMPKYFDTTKRQRVTALAMVELFDEKKQCYCVWLLEYHVEAIVFTTRNLLPGHFFQGRFAIGGRFKNKCHSYIQKVPKLFDSCFDYENNEIELYVDAIHNNRINGGHYEVFHNSLGYIRDSFDLLSPVGSETSVFIAVRRISCASEDGQHVWQIIRIQRNHSV